jgi:crossover junction endodeoxyribonuclease RusA
MPETTLILPWPARVLSPNARVHWAAKGKATAKARQWAHMACLGTNVQQSRDASAALHFDFHPPNQIRRDIHNMPVMCKAYVDGIADAIDADDQHFHVHWPVAWSYPVKGGAVRVRVVVA